MKFKKRVLSFFLLFSILLGSLLFLSRHPFSSEDDAFLRFTEELFQNQISSDTLSLHYTLANPSAFGISNAVSAFRLYTPEAEILSAADAENTLEVLRSFSLQNLSPDNRLTCEILTYQMQKELALHSYPYYEEIFSPTLGIQAQLPILLAEYSFRCEQDIKNYLSLLEHMDSYYESLLLYQQKKAQAGLFMSAETAQAVIAQCRSFLSHPEKHFLLSTFDSRLDSTDFLSETERSAYQNANRSLVFEHVFPAYELLIQGLTDLRDQGTNPYGLCYYAQGTAYYQALVAAHTGSGRTLPEIITLIETHMKEDLNTLAALAGDHPDLLKQERYALEKSNPDEILLTLKQKTSADFPVLPENNCEIKYVDASLEAYLSPAFYLTPPLDLNDSHVIYINPAADYDSLSLFTTLAHEGYPGHLYQSLFENTCQFNPARRLFSFGGYVEGWATYVEHLSYSYTSLPSHLSAFLSANSLLSLGIYARSDVGIHYEGWKETDLTDFLSSYGIREPQTIHSIYLAICQDPGNYLKYYLGAAEIRELKKDAVQTLENSFDLKSFHQFLLSVGPAPFPIIKAEFQSWLKQQPC